MLPPLGWGTALRESQDDGQERRRRKPLPEMQRPGHDQVQDMRRRRWSVGPTAGGDQLQLQIICTGTGLGNMPEVSRQRPRTVLVSTIEDEVFSRDRSLRALSAYSVEASPGAGYLHYPSLTHQETTD